MKPQNPAGTSDTLAVLKSFFKTFVANISFGNALTYDGAGNALTFQQDNSDGILVRVVFPSGNTPMVIQHNLGRRPLGYIQVVTNVVNVLYSGTPMIADNETITLYSSASADTTIYIF